jgi:hypothetical protein
MVDNFIPVMSYTITSCGIPFIIGSSKSLQSKSIAISEQQKQQQQSTILYYDQQTQQQQRQQQQQHYQLDDNWLQNCGYCKYFCL